MKHILESIDLDDLAFTDDSEKQTNVFSSEEEFFAFIKNSDLVYEECEFADENGTGRVLVYKNGNDFIQVSEETYLYNSKKKYHWKYAVKVYPKTISVTVYEKHP